MCFKFAFLGLHKTVLEAYMAMGVFRVASEQGLAQFATYSLRDLSKRKHHKVDDAPYGGGPGMLIRVDVLYPAWLEIKKNFFDDQNFKTVLMSPSGDPWSQVSARSFLKNECKNYLFVCGRFEGIDHRFLELTNACEISVGPYVLSGGEIPALLVVDSMVRLIPGVLGNSDSLEFESFSDSMVAEYPQYTRPAEYFGLKVPEVLLSGDHLKIKNWREKMSEEKTEFQAKNSERISVQNKISRGSSEDLS